MSHDLISAVIPNHSGADLLRRILPPLLRELPPDEGEVVVVDDASEDDSLHVLRTEFPRVRTIALGQNVGFGAACNRGVRDARHDLVLLLNSDMEVTPGSLALLREHFRDPQVFGAGPEYWSDDPSRPRPPRTSDPYWHQLSAPAGGGLVRRDVYLALGGFDPVYHPFYWEDLDLGWNAWRQGWKVIYETRCHFIHLESATIRRLYTPGYVQRIRMRNRCLFGWKNIHDPWILARFQAKSVLRAFSGLVRHRNPALLFGILDSIPLVAEALRHRAHGRAARRDREILRDAQALFPLLQQL